jgi:hypothetical protein
MSSIADIVERLENIEMALHLQVHKLNEEDYDFKSELSTYMYMHDLSTVGMDDKEISFTSYLPGSTFTYSDLDGDPQAFPDELNTLRAKHFAAVNSTVDDLYLLSMLHIRCEFELVSLVDVRSLGVLHTTNARNIHVYVMRDDDVMVFDSVSRKLKKDDAENLKHPRDAARHILASLSGPEIFISEVPAKLYDPVLEFALLDRIHCLKSGIPYDHSRSAGYSVLMDELNHLHDAFNESLSAFHAAQHKFFPKCVPPAEVVLNH